MEDSQMRKIVFQSVITAMVITQCLSLALAQDDDVTKYMEKLSSANASDKAYAAYALGEIGDKQAVEPLSALLKDRDKFVRSVAAYALGEIGDSSAIEFLRPALEDESSIVRAAAAKALGKIEGGKVEQYQTRYLNDLKDSDNAVRLRAATELGKIYPDKARHYQALGYINSLEDENIAIRAIAAATLGLLGDKQAVEPLVGALKDETVSVRRNAARALESIAAQLEDASAMQTAIMPLIDAFKDEDASVRKHAANALGEIGATATDGLITALKGEDATVRKHAADALVDVGSPAVSQLSIAIADENNAVRSIAADILGKIEPDKAREYQITRYINALKDEGEPVRVIAATSLGDIGDAQSVGVLITALRDDFPAVRASAADALGKLCARIKDENIVRPAIEPLIAAVKSDNSSLRGNSVEALEAIGLPAVEFLETALSNPDGIVRASANSILAKIEPTKASQYHITRYINDLKDADIFVRSNAAISLGKIGDEKAIKPLIDALSDENGAVRNNAANALKNIGEPVVQMLAVALEDGNATPTVRWYAANTLGQVAAHLMDTAVMQSAVASLITAIKDKDNSIRIVASNALAKIGAPAVDALIALFKDTNSSTRSIAARTLGQIGAPAIGPLVATLADKNAVVRSNAVSALAIADPDRALEHQVTRYVNDLNDDASPLIRASAALALGKIGGERAVDPLIVRLAKDTDLKVRANAAYSLGLLANKRAEPALNDVAKKDSEDFVKRIAKDAYEKLKRLP